ncbi:10971_t:CDS:2, partial [Racocetra fulgida]
SEAFLTNARYFEYEDNENDESFEDEQQTRENIENDYAIAMQLQEALNEETLNENTDENSPRMNEYGHFRGNFEQYVNEATESNRSYYSEDLNDESDDDLNRGICSYLAILINDGSIL